MDPGTKYVTAFQLYFPSEVTGVTKNLKIFLNLPMSC